MRLIDADVLKEKYTMVTKRYSGGIRECPAVLLEDIAEAPTIDAVSVARGEWMPIIEENEFGEVYQTGIYCSECGEVLIYEANYCPNCGAKMKGADDGSR